MLKVSVIIVNWNTKELLGSCLSSLKREMKSIPHEVIVVDNASVDDSVNFIKDNYRGVRLISNPFNKGFASACNQGASIATAEYLFFLNPDTIMLPETMEKLLNFYQSNTWIGAVGPQLIGRDNEPQNSVRRLPRLRDMLVGDTILKKIFPLGKRRLIYKLSNEKASVVDQVSGAAFLIGKDLWNRFGGMDERFFMFYEEVDLCKRIADFGYYVYYLPTAQIIHLGGGSRHQDKSKVFYYSVKSKFLYLNKYNSSLKLFWFKWIYKPLFLMQLVTEGRSKAKREFLKKCLIEFIKF